VKKFFCFGKDDFCDDTSGCLNCDFYNCSGGEEREAIDTNADHIRAMTDEELAAFLMELMFKTPCFGEGVFPYHPCPQDQDCKKCGVNWLKQPYKEDA
jgi:hypothetical protein